MRGTIASDEAVEAFLEKGGEIKKAPAGEATEILVGKRKRYKDGRGFIPAGTLVISMNEAKLKHQKQQEAKMSFGADNLNVSN